MILSDLIAESMIKLGQAFERTATGGSTTTVVDSTLALQGGDDDWNGGTMIIRYTTDGNAPQGEFATITDYVNATGTFTVGTLTAAVGAGDAYMYTTARWPLKLIIELANMGLRSLGYIDLKDTTITTTDATEYEWSNSRPIRVDVQTSKVTDNNRWMELRNWSFEKGEIGSSSVIVTPSLSTGYTLRVWYRGLHPTLALYDDLIDDDIHPDVAVWATVVQALKWMDARTQSEEAGITQSLNDARQELDNVKALSPIHRERRKGKVMIV